MPATLNDEKRSAIAEKLADMKAIQSLIIENEQVFLQECNDAGLRDRLEDMLEDDRKNLEIVETAITQYGIQSEPKQTVRQMVETAKHVTQASEMSLYEKMAQHELLKHGQVVSGLVVHKAAQVVGQDVEEALAPLNAVNFENRAHQERLKGMLEYLGTRELTGQEPDQGLWGRVQDAVAAMTGVVGSAASQAAGKSADVDVMALIFADHQKAKTVMSEIRSATDANQIQALFGQLYKDLIVHAKAEEEVIYPAVRSFYGESDTQELYDEQAELEKILNEIKAMSPSDSSFKDRIRQVKNMVGDHTRQEESSMFAAMRKNMSGGQRQQLAEQFKQSKQRLQSQM